LARLHHFALLSWLWLAIALASASAFIACIVGVIRGPSRADVMPDEESDTDLGIEEVLWDSDDPNQSLQDRYNHDTNFARLKVKYYLRDAKKYGKYAGRIRLAAIVLGTAGVVMPLIDAALPPGTVHIGAWGYVVIALAAGLFSMDRFGGFSWKWTRSTIIWVTLRRQLAEFQHDWDILMLRRDSEVHGKKEEEKQKEEKLMVDRLARLKDFRHSVEVIVAQECKEWAEMTLAARLELEQALARDLNNKPRMASEQHQSGDQDVRSEERPSAPGPS
jgi:SMODS and SLOG-associating 2TM effector domain 2